MDPNPAYKRLIQLHLLKIIGANLSPESKNRPVIRLLQGSASWRSVEPRAVAVDVVGTGGEAGAVAADHRYEGLV